MTLVETWREAVHCWAASNPKINKVFFIGSWITGKARTDSDLDIAIILVDEYGYGDWFFESEKWRAELDLLVFPSVHLLRGGGSLENSIVESAIVDHGLLVFRREISDC